MVLVKTSASTILDRAKRDNWSLSKLIGSGVRMLPSACRLCGARAGGIGLCAECINDLPRPDLRTQLSLRGVTSIYSTFRYAYPINKLITRTKFKSDIGTANLLGQLMAAHIPGNFAYPNLICPVPLPANRLIQRGFNQALELSRAVGKKLQIKIEPTLLKRRGYQRSQSELTKSQRQANLRDAFYVERPIPGAFILIVDDVLTTGITATAAARAVLAAGADRVDFWACARVA